MKRLLALLLCAALVLPCAALAETERRTYSFFGTFDTIIILTAYTETQEAFDAAAELCEREFNRLDDIFNAYRHSDTVNNLWAINNGAWKEPMTVPRELMDVLVLCRDLQTQYPDTTNVAIGRVTALWHDASMHAEDDPMTAALPDADALAAAAEHCDFSAVVLDEENSAVFYTDEKVRIDLGAAAKGWTAGFVARELAETLDSFSINAGGNIVLGGPPENRTGSWKIGVQDPDSVIIGGNTTLLTISLPGPAAVVTSGDYQRYFTVDGVRYHHIIDPKTRYPAKYIRAVTIVAPDSGTADFLSTAAFTMPYAQSRAMVEERPDTEALWVLNDGTLEMTEGFAALILPE